MKPNGTFAIVLLLLVFMAGCGEDSEDADTTPPVAPTLKARSINSLYAETGIRPEPWTTGGDYWIRVEWYPNREEDLAGYLVYRRSEMDPEFPDAPIRDLVLGQVPSRDEDPYFIDFDTENLQPDDTTGESRGYYYAVRAYDVSDNLSDFSVAAYYRLISNPRNFYVWNPSPGEYYLEWTFEGGPEIFFDYFMIRIWDEETGQPMWWMQYIEYSSTHSVPLNADGTAEPFVSGRRYVWKLSVIANSHPPPRTPAGSAVKSSFEYQD